MTEDPDDPGAWPPPWFDPERYALVTPVNVQALAHPIRVSLLRLLREDGPGSATTLAERIGQSSGVTSYHLRALADAGFIEEDVERGTRRERWWRPVHEGITFSFRVPGHGGSDAQVEAAERYMRAVAQVAYERVLGYIDTLSARHDELHLLPWQLGETTLSLSRAEARELALRIHALVAPYRSDQRGRARGPGGPDDDGEGRERAVLQFQLVPDEPDATAPRRA
ncbi:ArsR/SmtB family transcription factor [Jiangella endophytica]|uniref:ArsR/SmtB family transcription factor n=1 Tax=Jiangella endophytica TaxID=1623398 RepID=UPI000E341372|nr:helix-turn-helix domain-containing protein [Jiangella endophytica]